MWTESQKLKLTDLFSVSHSGWGPLGGSKAVFLPVGNGYFGINLDEIEFGGALTELAKKEMNHEINYAGIRVVTTGLVLRRASCGSVAPSSTSQQPQTH